jgi:hypothetical protein
MGPLAVTQESYNFGNTAFHPTGFPGPGVELIASVFHPTDLTGGPLPLLVFLHGRHSTTYDPTTGSAFLEWPATGNHLPIESYKGYDYLANVMASHGYFVISISANGINAFDNSVGDAGALARAQLIQRHLDIWHDLTTTGVVTGLPDGTPNMPFGTRFVGKVDLQNIGTMGHSRGGEGVVRHYLYNQSLGSPYGIKAVFALAPIDFQREVITNVPFAVLLPYNDGDVSDLEGVGFFDDARYSSPGDMAPKHTIEVIGADHNFYNTVWTPGLYPFVGAPPGFGGTFEDRSGTTRLTPTMEQGTGLAYMSAFFRTYIGKESQFFPYLTGDAPPPPSATVGADHIFVGYQPADNASARRDVNRLTTTSNLTTDTLGGAVTQSGLTTYSIGPTFPSDSLNALRLGWSSTTAFWQNDLPAGFRDESRYYALQFRVSDLLTATTDFSVTLTDGAGHSATTTVGAQYPSPGSSPLFAPPDGGLHHVLNDVRLPLSAFVGIDLTDVRSIRFTFDQRSSGSLWLADLMFANRALGLAVVSASPASEEIVTTKPTDFIIDLSDAYRPSSVHADALVVNGIPADSVTLTSPTRLTFHYNTSPVTAEGLQTRSIAAGAILRDQDSEPLQAFSDTFRYSALRLQVTSTVPAVGSALVLPSPTLTFNFNRPVDPTSVSAGDLHLSAGTVAGFSVAADHLSVTFTLGGLTSEDPLTVNLSGINDVPGNPMIPFSGSFILQFGAPVPLPATKAIAPAGSLVYQTQFSAGRAGIDFTGDTDSFTINVNAAQQITVLIHPTSSTLRSTIQLLDPNSVLIGSATAPSAGQDDLLQTVAANTNGTYTIVVGGASGTLGAYTVQVYLNAGLEAEDHGGPSSQTSATAQNLEPLFAPLPGASASQQAAVIADNGVNAPGTDYYSLNLSAGQSATVALSQLTGGGLHLQLKNAAGTTMAQDRTGPTNVSEIISNFVAPSAGTYYIVVTGSQPATYDLVVTRGADFNTKPDSSFLPNPAQYLVPTAGGEAVVLGNVGGTGTGSLASAKVLYYVDSTHSNPFATALTALGITPTVAGSYFDFETKLAAGGWDLAILFDQGNFDTSWATPLANYISQGGRAIAATWTQDNTAAAALGAQYTGSNNGTAITQTDTTNPIWTGIGNPFNLFNPGWGTFATGLRPTTGTSIGQFANGDSGLIVGNNQHTLLNGFLSDSISGSTQAVQFAQNEIKFELAALLGPPADMYEVSLTDGQTLVAQTATPGAGPGEFGNTLDPMLNVYDPNGNLVASDDNSAPDGVNARVSYTVPTGGAGLYFVEIRPSPLTPTPTHGEYVLTIQGPNTPTNAPFTVTSTTPANKAYLTAAPRTLTVSFNHNILLTSLAASELTVDGMSATAFTVVDGTTVTFTLPTLPSQEVHTVSIAGGLIKDVPGTPLTDYFGYFLVNTVPPNVISSSIQENDFVPSDGTLTYTMQFSEPLNPSTVTAAAFTLHGNGANQNYTPASFSYIIDTSTLTITYTGLHDDSYLLRANSSIIKDFFGLQLDGETIVGGRSVWPIPPGHTGNGIQGGDFTVDFTLDVTGAIAYPTPLTAVAPLGSLIYQGAPYFSTLLQSGEQDTFALKVNGGQTITLLVHPTSATLQPTLTVTDPNNNSSSASAAAGKDAILQTFPASTTGTYTITVGGAANTFGSYTVQVFLNAAVESEEHGGSRDDTRATAQDLTPAFLTLPKSASRAAVLGTTDTTVSSMTTVFSADFESGLQGFTINNSIPGRGTGLWHLSTGRGNQSGHSPTQSLYYGQGEGASGGGTYDTGDANAGALTSPSITLPTGGGISLGFNYVLQTERFTGFDVAQLQISTNGGASFTTLATYNVVAESSVWRAATPVNLSAYSGQTVQLRWFFDTVDNFANNFEGWYVDDVSVTQQVTTPDYYSLSLGAGDTAAIDLKALNGGNLTLQVENAAGVVVATSTTGATNVDRFIDKFVAPATGTYYIRVGGDGGKDYSLVVTRNAAFDTEPNGTFATAQDITGTVGPLGYIEAADQDWYKVTVTAGQTLTFITSTPSDDPAGQFPNTLSPHIQLYDPSGNLVATGTKLADGRNETITYTALVSGAYRILATGDNGSRGEYFLDPVETDSTSLPPPDRGSGPGMGSLIGVRATPASTRLGAQPEPSASLAWFAPIRSDMPFSAVGSASAMPLAQVLTQVFAADQRVPAVAQLGAGYGVALPTPPWESDARVESEGESLLLGTLDYLIADGLGSSPWAEEGLTETENQGSESE